MLLTDVRLARRSTLFHRFLKIKHLKLLVLDIELALLLLDSAKERIPDDLREVSERVLRLLRVKVVDVLNAVLHTIHDHVVAVGVVDEVWLVGQVGRDLHKAIADVVGNARSFFTLCFSLLHAVKILDHSGEELLVVNVVGLGLLFFGSAWH